MQRLRFLLFFSLNYGLGIAMAYFFLFSALYLQKENILFGGFVFTILFVALFGWLYFRGVPLLTWKQRIEVIAVWVGLTILLDLLLLYTLQGGTIGDLGSFTLIGYLMIIVTLFVAAYVTAGGDHPRITSPNLAIDTTENDA